MIAEPARISLLIADVDGTLLTPDKILTPAAIAAVRRLDEAEIGFTIISSRPPRGMAPILAQLAVRLPFAAFNGGSLLAPDLAPIEAHRLTPQAARGMLALLAAHGVAAWVYADGDWRVQDPGGTRVAREQHALGYGPMRVEGFEDVIGRVDKIVGVCDDHALLTSVETAARRLLDGAATISRSQPYYLDVTHPKANKGEGVKGLCRLIGVDSGRTAVIGDMFNDVAMFAEAGFAIAMGQAPEPVKLSARAVTLSNTEEGFAHAVERLVLPCGSTRQGQGNGD